MYNLIVSGDPEAWTGNRSALSLLRLGEHTAESLKARYQRLDDQAIEELTSFPALFAYEEPHGLPARVGRVTRIVRPSGGNVRFEYAFEESIAPIPAAKVSSLAWELDINDWELNRTHWAIKDIDLLQILREEGLIKGTVSVTKRVAESVYRPSERVVIAPTVFAIPDVEPGNTFVAVMMPFDTAFDPVFAAIREASRNAGFACQRADDDEIWEDSTIIQGVFNLIYRSAVVIVDLSGRNANVMYETGIAHTLGRPVVPIAQTVDQVPFDLAHHRVLKYLLNSEGLAVLTEKLAAKLRRYNVV